MSHATPRILLAVFLSALWIEAGENPDPAQKQAPPPELADAVRDFYQQVNLLSEKQKESRAELARKIKALAPGEAPAEWHAQLARRRAALERKVASEVDPRQAAGMAARLQGGLDAKRKAAVGLILGNGYRGKDDQPKVDEAVKAVTEIWDHAFTSMLETNAPLKKTLEDLAELDGYLALYPSADAPAAFDVKAAALAFNEAVRQAWMKPEWRKIHEYNDGLPYLSAEEKLHLKVLNEYRMMLGLHPLECDVRLLAAARGHARDMAEKKFFSHDSPLPGKRSFSDRAAREGYRAAMGENILFGSTSGERAFRNWYNSPGHHKNMIGASKQIGAGNHQSHWCQVFGGEGPFAARGVKPAQVTCYERVLSLPADAGAKERLEVAQYAFTNKLWDAAKQQLEEVLKLEPENATAKNVLAQVERELARQAPKKR